MKIRIAVSILLPAAAATALARPTAGQLVAPDRKDRGAFARYDRDVELVFRQAFAPAVTLRAIVYPAFSPEYSVGVRHSQNGYEIFGLRASRSVSGYLLIDSMRQGRAGTTDLNGKDQTGSEIARLSRGLPANPADLPVSRCSVRIDSGLAEALHGAWRKMLQSVAPATGSSGGTDGITYGFSMEIHGHRLIGGTWSPDRRSRPGRMAEIAERMQSYCEKRRPGDARRMIELARQLTREA